MINTAKISCIFLQVIIIAQIIMVRQAGALDVNAECHYLYVERNYIYAKNGYCFKTKLAQRIFGYGSMSSFPDPNDCETSPQLSVDENARINEILNQESSKEYACKSEELDPVKLKDALIQFLMGEVVSG